MLVKRSSAPKQLSLVRGSSEGVGCSAHASAPKLADAYLFSHAFFITMTGRIALHATQLAFATSCQRMSSITFDSLGGGTGSLYAMHLDSSIGLKGLLQGFRALSQPELSIWGFSSHKNSAIQVSSSSTRDLANEGLS